MNDAPNRPRRHRTGTLRYGMDATLLLFVYISPKGHLVEVISAESIDEAWVIATGWGDEIDIEMQKKDGWRLWPCTVEWEEADD